MIRPITISLCCVITLCLVLSVAAENGPKPVPARPTGTLTGKERLGPKWTDEQRIDNCKVPADLRGPKPRPERCGDGTGEKR